jgi:hypothetical protein
MYLLPLMGSWTLHFAGKRGGEFETRGLVREAVFR